MIILKFKYNNYNNKKNNNNNKLNKINNNLCNNKYKFKIYIINKVIKILINNNNNNLKI